MTLSAAAEGWLVRLTLDEVFSIHGLFLFDAAMFATISILVACCFNSRCVQASVRNGTLCEVDANALVEASTICNFFFYTRGMLETTFAMIVMFDWNRQHGTAKLPLNAWLDTCYLFKFICELVALALYVESLHKSFSM